MRRVEVFLVATFQRNMGGDEHAVFVDADLIGKYVNIEGDVWCRARCRDCR